MSSKAAVARTGTNYKSDSKGLDAFLEARASGTRAGRFCPAGGPGYCGLGADSVAGFTANPGPHLQ
jgi:hypothetical protein